jgi:hypothetical protein
MLHRQPIIGVRNLCVTLKQRNKIIGNSKTLIKGVLLSNLPKLEIWLHCFVIVWQTASVFHIHFLKKNTQISKYFIPKILPLMFSNTVNYCSMYFMLIWKYVHPFCVFVTFCHKVCTPTRLLRSRQS